MQWGFSWVLCQLVRVRGRLEVNGYLFEDLSLGFFRHGGGEAQSGVRESDLSLGRVTQGRSWEVTRKRRWR